jgi:hypothetical protein
VDGHHNANETLMMRTHHVIHGNTTAILMLMAIATASMMPSLVAMMVMMALMLLLEIGAIVMVMAVVGVVGSHATEQECFVGQGTATSSLRTGVFRVA